MEKSSIGLELLNKTAEIVIAFDGQGNILFGNPSTFDKLNYTEDKLMQCNMSELFRQEFQKENGEYAPFDVQLLREKEETGMYRSNSSCFPVAVQVFEAGTKEYYLLAQDISWQKNMDLRVHQLQEQEKENNRLHNEFTANVTHELRTPLNGIRGHVSTIMEMTQDNSEVKATLDIIMYCCDNMAAIINNILDFSKLEAGKFLLEKKEFDFYKMMDQVLATHMVEINKKDLGISVYIDESIPQFLIGDSLRIGQILNNLLSNAVKFTHIGRISVDVSKTMHINDEVELFFMVRDSGIGISKEEQDKIFQSFQQVDASVTRRYGGTGLGLSITKQLVEMMGGNVHLDSTKGRGSCFSFNIKLRTSQSASQSKEISQTIEKWGNLIGGMSKEEEKDIFTYGSPENLAELKKRVEKLILSIELGSWEKAEMLASTIKDLVDASNGNMKRAMLRLEMAIRKEDYTKSLAAFEQLRKVLQEGGIATE